MTAPAANKDHDNATPSGLTNGAAVLTSTLSSVVVQTPQAWQGMFCRFMFIGAVATDYLVIRFGATSSVTASLSSASTLAGAGSSNSPYVITELASEGHIVLMHGMAIRERIDGRHLYFAHISSTSSGHLFISHKTGNHGLG